MFGRSRVAPLLSSGRSRAGKVVKMVADFPTAGEKKKKSNIENGSEARVDLPRVGLTYLTVSEFAAPQS